MTLRMIAAGVLFLAFTMVACAAEEPKLGGYTKASVTDKEMIAAVDFAIKAETETLQEPKTDPPAKLELVQIVNAEEQVVAGKKYRLTLKVKHNSKERTAEAIVWWQEWRKPDPYQLTSWKWLDP